VIEGGSSFSVEVGGIPKESAKPPSSNLLLKEKVLYIGRRKIIHKKW